MAICSFFTYTYHLLVLTTLDLCVIVADVDFKLVINSTDGRAPLSHFWESTGFCPPDPHQHADMFDLGADMKHNIALIGSVPNSGIKQVRIHWLFDLVKVKSISKGGKPEYNFSMLDNLIELLWQYNLKPGFELMGSPSGFFTDFENKTQVILWSDLVKQTAQRYLYMYSQAVTTWNFETWNEPDCGDYDGVSMTITGFINYYDACYDGLKSVNTSLMLGGPGDGCDFSSVRSKYSDALLDHIVNGRNFFTGKKDLTIDFLSYHRKGNGRSSKILRGENEILSHIRERFPSLASKPFFNDEADPLVGWSKNMEWRADATYAAMVVKVIAQHQNVVLGRTSHHKYNFTLLSNDNAFLSWHPHQFTQRTLNARFQMNNTSPSHVQLIRKPVHSAMTLLSMLGEQQLFVNLTYYNDGKAVKNDSRVGAVASVHAPSYHSYNCSSSDSWQMTVLLYSSDDTKVNSSVSVKLFDIDIYGLPDNVHECLVVGYMIDNSPVSNPYLTWKKLGRPKFPTIKQFQQIRKTTGPRRIFLFKMNVWDVKKRVNVALPQPSVVLIHLCARPRMAPGQVESVRISNITSGQILITWSDRSVNTRCLLKYSVEFSRKSRVGPYRLINFDRDDITTAFVYVPVDSFGRTSDAYVSGFYRIAAVNYWKQYGTYSPPVRYPSPI